MVVVVDAGLEQILDAALELLKPSQPIYVVTIESSAKGRPNLLDIFCNKSTIHSPRVKVYLQIGIIRLKPLYFPVTYFMKL